MVFGRPLRKAFLDPFLVMLGLASTLASAAPTPTPAAPTSQPASANNPPKSNAPAGGYVNPAPDGILRVGAEQIQLPAGLKFPSYDWDAKAFAYLIPEPDQQKLWVEFQKDRVDLALKKTDLKLTLLETEHNLIYTNWPSAEHKFLKESIEGLFKLLAKQFALTTPDQHFLGKLPVFVLENREQFLAATEKGFGINISPNWTGVCSADKLGLVRVFTYKQESSVQKDYKVLWGEIMAHEGTHAFLSRYQTNVHVVSWMNEGLAEYMSSQLMIPYGGKKGRYSLASAQKTAKAGKSVQEPVFHTTRMTDFDDYAVASTVTNMLIAQNAKAYVQMIKDTKDGIEPEKALQKNFKGVDYEMLETLWRKWVQNQK